MPVQPGLSQFRALIGHQLGINGTKSAKKWHFRGVHPNSEICFYQDLRSTPNGIRTRAATLKGWAKLNWTNLETADQQRY